MWWRPLKLCSGILKEQSRSSLVKQTMYGRHRITKWSLVISPTLTTVVVPVITRLFHPGLVSSYTRQLHSSHSLPSLASRPAVFISNSTDGSDGYFVHISFILNWLLVREPSVNIAFVSPPLPKRFITESFHGFSTGVPFHHLRHLLLRCPVKLILR